MQSQLATTGWKLPVFIFPQSFTFFLDDQSTHKQILTLYNPYDFPIKFTILCTAPNKYQVVNTGGIIRPKCCIDIVVRHISLLLSNCNVVDKFRIQIQEHPSKQVIGKRDVEAKLLVTSADVTERSTPDPEIFQQLPISESRQQQSYALTAQNKAVDRGTNFVALVAGIICIVALLLPTEGEQSNTVPEYLHLSVNFKLIFSFVLGLVTIIILRL